MAPRALGLRCGDKGSFLRTLREGAATRGRREEEEEDEDEAWQPRGLITAREGGRPATGTGAAHEVLVAIHHHLVAIHHHPQPSTVTQQPSTVTYSPIPTEEEEEEDGCMREAERWPPAEGLPGPAAPLPVPTSR
ncbi:hypothetical protein llap_21718 [Limosa lapponica baueri]|uniref:Uncharacterized protein n=1 Tax=Limosa lapponica baueri TaxID=1758121 RepID=A0A2I0T2F6_LIMLA|nr:hypothetical protein llap_21718 [Limosa lapponica baueri]